MTRSPIRYSTAQKLLHWAIAALIAAQYLAFDSIGRTFNQVLRDGAYNYPADALGHIIIGSAILGLMVLRLALRLHHGVPDAPAGEPTLFQKLAHFGHAGFYLLLLALPVTGLGAWVFQAAAPADLHETLTTALLALIAVHLAAVALHQFWWKTGLLKRMV